MNKVGHPAKADGLSSQAMEPQASPPKASIPDALLFDIAGWYGPAKSITPRMSLDLQSLAESYQTATGIAKKEIGLAIVRHLKQIEGWPSPLRWFKKTNDARSWTIVSYHHRAQLCWEWAWWLNIGRASRGRSWNPQRWISWGRGRFSVGIPRLFDISFQRQPYGWMLSGDGENLIRATAKAIEARRAETGTGSVHESAVGNADLPKGTRHD